MTLLSSIFLRIQYYVLYSVLSYSSGCFETKVFEIHLLHKWTKQLIFEILDRKLFANCSWQGSYYLYIIWETNINTYCSDRGSNILPTVQCSQEKKKTLSCWHHRNSNSTIVHNIVWDNNGVVLLYEIQCVQWCLKNFHWIGQLGRFSL